MNLSVKESQKLEKFISSVKKRLICEQNSEPHSAESPRIVEFSDPSRRSVPGSVDGTISNSESVSSQRRKRKNRNYKLHDDIRKRFDYSLGITHLETPSKRRKLVKKHLTFSTGLDSTNNEKSKKRKESR